MTNDPFEDIRDRTMGELNSEQLLRARELWLRQQIGWMPEYHQDNYNALFAVIDNLRSKLIARQPAKAEEDTSPVCRRKSDPDPLLNHPLRRRSDLPEVEEES